MKTGPSVSRRNRQRHSSSRQKSAPDVHWWLLPAFAALLALELVVAFSAFRFWRIEADAISDLKKLVAANEFLSSAEKTSAELGRLSFQATVAPEPRNIAKYRDSLHVKSSAVLDDSVPAQLIGNPIHEASRELAKISTDIARLGDSESERLESASNEFESLLRIDERALAALEGRFEDENGGFTVVNTPDPAMARDLLRDQSYQLRRNNLGEALIAIQAAFDVRSLSLLTKISRNSIIFFPLALACLALLLIATPLLGWFLHNHITRSVAIHKTQIRKMNDDLSRLLGQLSKTTSERDELARRIDSSPTEQQQDDNSLSAPQRAPMDFHKPPATPLPLSSSLSEDLLTRLP